MRALGWIVAIGLTLYGGVLTVAGLLVEAGVFDTAGDADEHAIAWHAYFWDPWFFLWGVSRWPRCAVVRTGNGLSVDESKNVLALA